MREICESIKDRADEILEIWEEIARELPWLELPREHRIDGLPEVIAGIAEASLCEPLDREVHRQKISAAVEHGRERRKQGLDDSLLFTEYHLLRQAMWRFIRERFSPRRGIEAITRIDTAITLATIASLRGFHGAELDARGDWAQVIEQLTNESPLLTPSDGGYAAAD